METPICVVDAKTLIDHIHDIKRWIYNGQLRLVVPSAIYEHVEQIHQKSKEVKPASKEAARPKSSGRPAKKEQPAFDINPLLAKNFLSGLKTWKEEQAVSEQREFLEEKEKHGAVNFQNASEQYTPWKDVEIEEEMPAVADDRPTTWAEAARRKQHLANGGGHNQVQTGPTKPKLVAKNAGSETSPWKIKKDAPKISAKDVPGNLRPLMSCALWRLHESIDRNDANELFLLSDQPEIRTVAQKLNIIARSTKDLGILVTAKAKVHDLEEYGDLERDFGLQRRNQKAPDTKSPSQNGERSQESKTLKSNEEKDTANEIRMTVDDGDQVPEEELSHSTGDDPKPQAMNASAEPLTLGDDASEKPTTSIHPEVKVTDSQVRDIEKSSEGTAVESVSSDTNTGKDSSHPSVSVTEYQKPVWAPVKPSPTAVLLSEPNAESGHLTPGTDASNNNVWPSLGAAPPVPAAPPRSIDVAPEPEDSDDEVVLFVPQPKRFSNQKKPPQQNSRPSTPITQPPKKAADQSPKPSSTSGQAQSKSSSRGRNPVINNHGHPQSTNPPTVIDPDAFGRSFAVNPNPGPRTLPNSRSHHRPRRSAENAQISSNSHTADQQISRSSPPRQSLHHKSSRLSPAPPSSAGKDQSPEGEQTQRRSPQRRSKIVEPKEVVPRGRGQNHANPGAQPQPKSLNTRMVESEEFIPRSAFIGAQQSVASTEPDVEPKNVVPQTVNRPIQIQAREPESRVVDTDSFVRDSEPIAQSKPRSIEPRASGSNGNGPRNLTPAMPYRPRIPEPETIEPRASMPDVQYVLKSGSTRAATRGRGRLWTPS